MLRSVEFTDFCCYQHVKVKIGGAGLVLVTGQNLDTEGADSNGSGKSTLFKGLGWLLFEESIDKDKGPGVIRQGARKAEGVLKFADGHRFVRTRTKSGPGLEGFLPDGSPIEADKKGLQDYIEKLFGMDWLRFRNTVLFGQRDTKRFLSPDTSDSERKDLFHRIVGTAVFKTAHEKVKARALELKREIDKLDEQLGRLNDQIGTSGDDIDSMETDSTEWEESRKAEIKRLKAEAKTQLDEADALTPDGLAEARDELKRIRVTKRDLAALRTAVKEATAERVKLVRERDALEAERKELVAKAEAATESLDAAGEGRCPVCDSDLTEGHAADHLVKIRREGARALEDAEERERARDAYKAKLKQASKAIEDAETAVEEAEELEAADAERIGELKARIAELEAVSTRAAEKREHARTLLGTARTKSMEANPYSKRIAKAREDVAQWKAERKKAKTERVTLHDERQHVMFWVKGYSPEGLPSWALDSVMPFITDRANHYLQTLADGDLTVVFNTQSELKSAKGEIRDRISVDWTVEGIKNASPSGGQWRKMEIATDLAFMDLAVEYGAKPDLLLMDEVFDGLDGEGQERVVEVLKELRTRRASVFVVSHDDRIKEAFEKELVFIKEGGVSVTSTRKHTR